MLYKSTRTRRKLAVLGVKRKLKTIIPRLGVPVPKTTWLDKHLKEFVKPVVDEIKAPTNGELNNVSSGYDVSPIVLQHLVDTWNEVKKYANGRRILLPGRDCYLFEILAQMEGNGKVDFRPDLNSTTSDYFSQKLKEKYKDHFVIDSGLAGSIPTKLGHKDFRLVLYNGNKGKKNHQIFPDMVNMDQSSPHYKLYCLLEGSIKYWDHASAPNGVADKFSQNLISYKPSFILAAQLTIHVCNFLMSSTCKGFKCAYL